MELKTNRGLFKYLVFSFLTLGIYPLYLIHAAAVETNKTCKEDGKKTAGLLLYFLFTLLTLGIYGLVWNFKLVERWAKFMRNRNKSPRLDGGKYLLWLILGAMIGIGPIVAQYLYLHAWNDVNEVYSKEASAVAQVPPPAK